MHDALQATIQHRLARRLVVSAVSVLTAPGVPSCAFLLLLAMLLIPLDATLARWFSSSADSIVPDGVFLFLSRSGRAAANLVLLGSILACSRLRRWRVAYFSVIGGVITTLVVETVKHLVGRARPDTEQFALVFSPLSDAGDWHSFPSGDTANAFLVAAFCVALYPRYAAFFWSWGILVAVSRVALARHFPADVLAGAGIGILVGSLLVARLELPLAPPGVMPVQRHSGCGWFSPHRTPCKPFRSSGTSISTAPTSTCPAFTAHPNAPRITASKWCCKMVRTICGLTSQ
ncbi:MAG: phosphatase PAP2 family protein [Armatimonadetes bacterium]|nr:phosphatase PAP2 family protein [Armatimonadota bacterium]